MAHTPTSLIHPHSGKPGENRQLQRKTGQRAKGPAPPEYPEAPAGESHTHAAPLWPGEDGEDSGLAVRKQAVLGWVSLVCMSACVHVRVPVCAGACVQVIKYECACM